MSYYVRLEIAWDGEGPDPFTAAAHKKIMACVEGYLRAEGEDGRIDWLDEFREAFSGKSAEIKFLDEDWTLRLVTHVSERFPKSGFWARGVGEEFDDAWTFHVRGGELQWGASLKGDVRGVARSAVPMPEWPAPVEIDRVIVEAYLRKYVGEVLAEQPPTATHGALTLRRIGDKRPRALVYVGPLGRDGFLRIVELVDAAYRVQVYRDPRRMLKQPVATAEKPLGYYE